MATIQYVPCCPYCHWERTHKIEPKAKHFSHYKNYRSSRPNQTNYIKSSEKNQIFLIDNLDHKPTIHRISTNTPQKEITSNKISSKTKENLVLRSKEREEAI